MAKYGKVQSVNTFGKLCVKRKKALVCVKYHLTPFFPGMAHSQFIRFMVPSGFLVGTATKPCQFRKKQILKGASR